MISSDFKSQNWSVETERLRNTPALADSVHVEFLYRIWTTPEVMRFVGFPEGLRTDRQQIRAQLEKPRQSEYDRCLLVALEESGELIGECKLGTPDENGVAHTDVKLLPEHWGKGYGTEVKQALVDYLFTHTDCRGVRATPNRRNLASIRMQEAVGARRVAEGCHRFPDEMRSYTTDVPYIEYVVERDVWARGRSGKHSA